MNQNFSELNDSQLCDCIELQGAFSELEFRYMWLIRHKAKELLGENHIDTDDFIQEGLLGLYQSAKSFKDDKKTSFKTYASVCIHNRMLNELRKNARHNKGEKTLSLEQVEFSVPSPEEDVELKEDFKAVLNQIHLSLSQFEQKILALYLSGYKRSEISVEHGISLKAYDNALSRCKKKLRSKNVF